MFHNFMKFSKNVHASNQNFADLIYFYQVAYKMHPKIGGNSAPQSSAGFIKTPF